MTQILNELIDAARQLTQEGLVTGAGGNVSAREGDSMWISPSGFSLGDASAKDYPRISVSSGEILDGEHRPSSEVLMHLEVYRVRPEVRSIVHAHPKMTVALTCAGHDLRPLYADYYVYLGSHVPHVPYITVTTKELAAAVSKEFKAPDCRGMVLRNHGTITVGQSVKEALFRTLAMEEQAFIQHHALCVGTPAYLTPDECAKLDALDSEDYRRRLLAEMQESSQQAPGS